MSDGLEEVQRLLLRMYLADASSLCDQVQHASLLSIRLLLFALSSRQLPSNKQMSTEIVIADTCSTFHSLPDLKLNKLEPTSRGCNT